MELDALSQKYDVSVKLTFEAPIYPEDPSDLFELAELEKEAILNNLESIFSDLQIIELDVAPAIGE